VPEPQPAVTLHDLREPVQTPSDGIVSRALHNDPDVRVVSFSFAPGQQLTDHTAAVPVLMLVVEGEGRIGVAGEEYTARAGTLLHVPANTPHSVVATTPLNLLLVLIKRAAPAA
jgi:quercetin dioxygenase-like cupin family protein